MAQLFALICDTVKPGTVSSSSGMFVAPDRRMSSCVMTKVAAAAWDILCSVFETDVTWMFVKSSMFIAARSGFCANFCCGFFWAPTSRHTAQTINQQAISLIGLFIKNPLQPRGTLLLCGITLHIFPDKIAVWQAYDSDHRPAPMNLRGLSIYEREASAMAASARGSTCR